MLGLRVCAVTSAAFCGLALLLPAPAAFYSSAFAGCTR
jgi:hypothetical protein